MTPYLNVMRATKLMTELLCTGLNMEEQKRLEIFGLNMVVIQKFKRHFRSGITIQMHLYVS